MTQKYCLYVRYTITYSIKYVFFKNIKYKYWLKNIWYLLKDIKYKIKLYKNKYNEYYLFKRLYIISFRKIYSSFYLSYNQKKDIFLTFFLNIIKFNSN